jgi:hypothetical protein
MAGMIVQCSVLESRIRGSALTESPLSGSALGGNQLTPALLTRQATATRVINGITGFDAGGENNKYGSFSDFASGSINDGIRFDETDLKYPVPPPSTMYDATSRKWNLYGTRVDNYSWNGYYGDSVAYYDTPSGFGAQASSITTNTTNNFPSANGIVFTSVYPTLVSSSFHGWNADDNTPIPSTMLWQSIASQTQQQFGNNSSTRGLPWTCLYDKIASTLSNQIDIGANYTRTYDDFFSLDFPTLFTSSAGGFGTSYKTLSANYNTDYTGYSSASFNDSLVSGSTGAYTAPLSGLSAYNGWTITAGMQGHSSIKLTRGQARVIGSIGTNLYFIGLVQIAEHPQTWQLGAGSLVNFSGSHFSRQIDLVDFGVIEDYQIMGYHKDINLPFPNGAFPLQNVNDTAIVSKHYFGVIGQDPTTWAKTYGYNFGTV